MPTGLSRQTASDKSVEEEEEEEKGPQMVHLGISIAALLAALLFCYAAYSSDHTPNRVSDYLFGQPVAAEGSGGGGVSAADEEDASGGDEEGTSSSDEEESSSDEEGGEEEE